VTCLCEVEIRGAVVLKWLQIARRLRSHVPEPSFYQACERWAYPVFLLSSTNLPALQHSTPLSRRMPETASAGVLTQKAMGFRASVSSSTALLLPSEVFLGT